MAWRVGIDIGGTFTDVAAADLTSGEVRLRKLSSTSSNLAEGAAVGLLALANQVPLGRIAVLAHGTTAGTNALLEGTGARTGLITTAGFRDLLEIARQKRPSLYDLRARKARALVPRWLRREVPERLRFDGSVIRPLDVSAVRKELQYLAAEGIESLAICLLHSYANACHEHAVRELAQELLPDAYVTASCDVLPRFREYERLSTTVVNAYLGPLMDRYLDELSVRIEKAGVGAAPYIMQSSGGLAPLVEARRRPAATVLSGPAAGAAAAVRLCAALGIERAIAIDMGGTSTDISLVEGGLPASARGREVGGYRVELPGVDVRCIGAGGGSVFAVDPGGMPRVGPRSAGAEPGPVCYARGGEEPTLTDALVVLGRIAPKGLLDGEMPLDREAARRAIAEKVGARLGLGTEQAALGAVELAAANVRRAVESMTVARGRDPREFSLLAAGGAGPLVACEVASELEIEQVVVPPWPGTFSAYGLLASDLRRDWVETHLLPARGACLPELVGHFHRLERQAQEWIQSHGADGEWRVLRSLSARYRGQDYELDIGVPAGRLTEPVLGRVIGTFHAAHERRYGYALPDHPVEFVDVTVAALGTVSQAPGAALPVRQERAAAPREERFVYAGDEENGRGCPVYDRSALLAGDRLDGPAVVEQYDSTTYLPRDCRARVEEQGSLLIEVDGGR